MIVKGVNEREKMKWCMRSGIKTVRKVINNEILIIINQRRQFLKSTFDVIITKHTQPVIYFSLNIYLKTIFPWRKTNKCKTHLITCSAY